MSAYQIWPCHVTQDANFEQFLLFADSTFDVRKSHKFLVEKLSTSEVISQKSHGVTPPVPLELNQLKRRNRKRQKLFLEVGRPRECKTPAPQ